MSELPTILERIKFRDAKPSDLKAINILLVDSQQDNMPSHVKNAIHERLTCKKQKHWTTEYAQIKKGHSSYIVQCAVDVVEGYNPVLVGFVLLRVCSLSSKSFAIGAAIPVKCNFDIIDSNREEGLAIEVSYLFLSKSYRRYGLGSMILKQAISTIISEDPTVEAIFSNVPSGDLASEAFFESLNFRALGYIPDFFKADDESCPSIFFAISVCEDPCVEYALKNGDEVPNLLSPELSRAGLLPRWLYRFLCQFVSPFAFALIVFVLAFFIFRLGIFNSNPDRASDDTNIQGDQFTYEYPN